MATADARLVRLKEEFSLGSGRVRESHFSGAGGMAVVREITALTDRLLQSVFDMAAEDAVREGAGRGWTLIAVGGYGRGELNPFSDVDIMFLGRQGASEKDRALPTKALHMMWDLGLNLGYSVRCAEDCVSLARNDFTIMTSLLEARYICGEKDIFDDFIRKISAGMRPKSVEEYIREKLAERAKRHKKHGDSVFLREPNLKEGAGGLRDIHAALWISRMKYGADTLRALVGKGILKENEWRRLRGAKDYLLRLRSELHYLSGHRQDTLTYELQEKAAVDFGYTPRPDRMAVENFMRAYYLRARGVSEITHDVIERALDKSQGRRWSFLPVTKKKLDEDFYVIGRSLCVSGEAREKFAARPEMIIEAFSHSQAQGMPMSDNLKESVKENLRLIDRKAREARAAGKVFLDILGRLDRLHATLDLMHGMKVLGRYLPEFGAVSALVQHDLYHRYTVDEHSLLAVKKIEDLLAADGLAYPEFKEALLGVRDRQTLMLALLLHDTGKALGSSHSEKGARLALQAALRLGMEAPRAGQVEFLVRNHLLMSHISQRRELSDPKVMENFCRIVDRRDLLDMLYLITYADMSTVGPELFNDWKMMLLKELYERASAYLKDRTSVLAYEKGRVAGLREIVTAEVRARKMGSAAEVKRFLDNMPVQYLLSVPGETAVRHFGLSKGIKGSDIIIDQVTNKRGYADMTVILHDMPGLFFSCAGTLAANNVNILSAQIFTGKDGVVIDTLQVTDYTKKASPDDDLWEKVKADMVKVLTGQVKVEQLMPARSAYAKRTTLKEIPARVLVDNEESDRFTVVEVFAADRVGLLHDITRTLYNLGCYIASAKVDTDSDLVVDVFYVTDIFRQKIEDPNRVKTIKNSLTEALTGEGK